MAIFVTAEQCTTIEFPFLVSAKGLSMTGWEGPITPNERRNGASVKRQLCGPLKFPKLEVLDSGMELWDVQTPSVEFPALTRSHQIILTRVDAATISFPKLVTIYDAECPSCCGFGVRDCKGLTKLEAPKLSSISGWMELTDLCQLPDANSRQLKAVAPMSAYNKFYNLGCCLAGASELECDSTCMCN